MWSLTNGKCMWVAPVPDPDPDHREPSTFFLFFSGLEDNPFNIFSKKRIEFLPLTINN